jgi:hypothetical protein
MKKIKSKKPEGYHTKTWYKQHYGVDPSILDISSVEKKNPYYASGPPMRLWKEADVKPYRSKEYILQYKKRKAAGLKAAKTRKENLKDWFDKQKREHPRVQEIVKRLWEIGEEIRLLHDEKEECRDNDFDYDSDDYHEYGFDHCDKCNTRSQKQQRLRDERETLFNELERITGRDKQIIQLARRYIRTERLADDHKKRWIDEKQKQLF